jgi:hypothetical protein
VGENQLKMRKIYLSVGKTCSNSQSPFFHHGDRLKFNLKIESRIIVMLVVHGCFLRAKDRSLICTGSSLPSLKREKGSVLCRIPQLLLLLSLVACIWTWE